LGPLDTSALGGIKYGKVTPTQIIDEAILSFPGPITYNTFT